MLFFHKNLMFRLKIVSANFTLTCLENVLKKVTLALQFEDILNVSYPPCSNKFFWNSLYRYLSLTIKVNLCKYLYICFSLQTHNQKFFSAGEVLWSQGTLIKVSSKKHKKKRSRRENFGNFFPQLLLKLHFEWNIQKDGRNQGLFFQNQGTFYDFQKRAGEASPTFPPRSCAPALLQWNLAQEQCFLKQSLYSSLALPTLYKGRDSSFINLALHHGCVFRNFPVNGNLAVSGLVGLVYDR